MPKINTAGIAGINQNLKFLMLLLKISAEKLYCIGVKKGQKMEKIASFTIDHTKLLPGIYVSRKDRVGGDTVTTFDIRMTKPNTEPFMNTAEIHTIEHLGATFLRNHPVYKDRIVYFGPMGCRTGFYLLMAGDLSSKEIAPLVTEMYEFIRDFEGDVPGASAVECGNYRDMDLATAKYLAGKYVSEVLSGISEERLVYPH